MGNSKRISAVVLPVLAVAAAGLFLAVSSVWGADLGLIQPISVRQAVARELAAPQALLAAEKEILSGEQVSPGDEITYRLFVQRDTSGPGEMVISDTLPAYTELVPGSLWVDFLSGQRGTWGYDADSRTIYYSSPMWGGTQGMPTTISYTVRVTITIPLPVGSTYLITNVAQVYDPPGEPLAGETNVVTTTVRWPTVYLPLVLRNYPPRWERGTGLGSNLTVYSIAVCPSDPDIVYAGTGGSGVYRSQNAGGSWTQSGLLGMTVRGVAVDPGNCGTLYAATFGDYLWKGTNSGANWTQLSSQLPYPRLYSVIVDPTNGNVIYVGTESAGVRRSGDGGTNWQNWGPGSYTVMDLGISADGGTLYAATFGTGVYRRDGGGWGPGGSPYGYVYGVAVDPQDADTVFAATRDEGVYRTINGGTSWTQVLSSPAKAYSAAVDPENSSIVYAGTSGGGVYRSTAGGASGTWQQFNVGLGNLTGRSLSIGPQSAEYLHTGTLDGAWRYSR